MNLRITIAIILMLLGFAFLAGGFVNIDFTHMIGGLVLWVIAWVIVPE